MQFWVRILGMSDFPSDDLFEISYFPLKREVVLKLLKPGLPLFERAFLASILVGLRLLTNNKFLYSKFVYGWFA